MSLGRSHNHAKDSNKDFFFKKLSKNNYTFRKSTIHKKSLAHQEDPLAEGEHGQEDVVGRGLAADGLAAGHGDHADLEHEFAKLGYVAIFLKKYLGNKFLLFI